MHRRAISIIGVGGGGCKIIDGISDVVREGTSVVAINTDARALEACRATTKLQIGLDKADGLGAGGNVDLGRISAEDDIELLRELFTKTELAIVVVCLGGGAGTGAAPVVIDVAKQAGALTLCFATMPFGFEGGQRNEAAKEAVATLHGVADAVIVVPNDRLSEYVGEANVVEAFERVNNILAVGICTVSKLITQPGVINLDFADLQRMVHGSESICTFGYGDAEGPGKAQSVVDQLLDSPLLEEGRILTDAQSMLVSIVGGPDLSLKDVGVIMDAISYRVMSGSQVSMGTVVDDEWTGRITVTAIVSEQWELPSQTQAVTLEPIESPVIEPDEPVIVEQVEEDVVDDLHQQAPLEPETISEPVVTLEQEVIVPQQKQRKPKRKRKAEQMQEKLSIGADKGRFRNVEPTIMNGEDLDIPTFVRRGITIAK